MVLGRGAEKANRLANEGAVRAGPGAGGSGLPRWLGGLRLAPRQARKDVTLWPLVARPDAPWAQGELWPVDEALEDGFVAVGRAHEPNQVRVESRAPAPVWIPVGEPLGAAGLAAQAVWLAPRGGAVVPVEPGDRGRACARCSRSLARGFRPVPGQVGFVVALHDRVVGLEVVLPAGPLARRLARRLAAWAPRLLAPELHAADAEGRAPAGLASPEALLRAAAALAPGCGVRELPGAWISLVHPPLDP